MEERVLRSGGGRGSRVLIRKQGVREEQGERNGKNVRDSRSLGRPPRSPRWTRGGRNGRLSLAAANTAMEAAIAECSKKPKRSAKTRGTEPLAHLTICEFLAGAEVFSGALRWQSGSTSNPE